MQAARRVKLAFTSWFRVPEQGMEKFEILSRASTILIPQQQGFHHDWNCVNKNAPLQTIHVLTSQHVTHPMRWTNYYPREQYPWLQFVHEKHMRYHLELRDAIDGRLYHSFVVKSRAIHPTRDISLLYIENEQEFQGYFDRFDVQQFISTRVDDLLLNLCPESLRENQRVIFQGYELHSGQNEIEGNMEEEVVVEATNEEQPLVPKVVSGYVNMIDSRSGRVFARTEKDVVSMGMCGGPVLAHSAQNDELQCVGILEGIVNNVRDGSMSFLQDNAVFIPSSELMDFINIAKEKQVEQEYYFKVLKNKEEEEDEW
jgi:hypothetical protein